MIERNKDVKFLSKSQALDNNFLLETLQDVCLNKKRSNFNLYRYNIEYVNSIYTFQIKGIEADYDEFTVGLFDFKENKIIQYFLFSTVEDISFSFITGDDVEGIALCIYAGVFRATKNKSIKIRKVDVLKKELSFEEKYVLVDEHNCYEGMDIDAELDNIIIKYNLDEYYPRYRQVKRAEKLIKILATGWGKHEKIAFISVGDKYYNDGRHFRNRHYLHGLFNDEQWEQIAFILCDRKGNEAEQIKVYNSDLYDYKNLENTDWKEYDRVYIISNSGDNFVGQWLRRHNVMFVSIYDYLSLNGLSEFASNKVDFYDFILDKSESCFDLHSYRANPIVYEYHEQKCKYEFNQKMEYKQLFLKKMIFLLLVLRDFEEVKKYIDFLNCNDISALKYREAVDEVLKLILKIKRKLQARKENDILALWIDDVSKDEMELKGEMPFLYSLRDKSIWFDNMISMNPHTHEVLRTMFVRKKLIDDNTNAIKSIRTDNSIVISDLEQNGYNVKNIGDWYFPRKYLTQGEAEIYWPSSMRLWETIRQILKSKKPCFVLTHLLFETHPPHLSILMNDEELESQSKRSKSGMREIDNLLKFYMGLLGPKATSIIFSDHGKEFFWPRHHVFFSIYSTKYQPMRISEICSNYDFYELIHGMINGRKILIKDLSKGWAEIQGNNIRNGKIDSIMERKRFPLNACPSFASSFCGYRGAVVKEYLYLYFSNGREFLFSFKDGFLPPQWFPREEDCCNVELLPYFRKLVNTENGMPANMLETDYYKELNKVYKNAYPRNIKKIEVIREVLSKTRDVVIYGGDNASKELYYALERNQRDNIIGFMDGDLQCTCSTIGLPIYTSFEDVKANAGTIILARRNAMRYEQEVEAYDEHVNIIDIYKLYVEMGIKCESNFWDFELFDEDFSS